MMMMMMMPALNDSALVAHTLSEVETQVKLIHFNWVI